MENNVSSRGLLCTEQNYKDSEGMLELAGRHCTMAFVHLSYNFKRKKIYIYNINFYCTLVYLRWRADSIVFTPHPKKKKKKKKKKGSQMYVELDMGHQQEILSLVF